jgi:hypothetical protein
VALTIDSSFVHSVICINGSCVGYILEYTTDHTPQPHTAHGPHTHNSNGLQHQAANEVVKSQVDYIPPNPACQLFPFPFHLPFSLFS